MADKSIKQMQYHMNISYIIFTSIECGAANITPYTLY